jgi:DNA-binding response OmpR family regulator
VLRAGAAVDVTPQELKVLRLFLRSGGRALSREDILARCWGAEYEGTPRTVDNFVRSLRVKLEIDPEAPQHFLTVRGHGYRFQK